MIRIIILFLFLYAAPFQHIWAQNNCETYKYNGDSVRYEACIKCEEAFEHYQFSKMFQNILDTAIFIDPNYAFPYREKSVAYLKSGDFISWKVWIDKAVVRDTLANLGYRASCRYQFFNDYEGCIKDVEALEQLISGDLGEIHNGDYHLLTIKAISYDGIGNTEQALKIMNEHMQKLNYYPLIYDYTLRGLFNMKLGKLELALQDFKSQEGVGDIAENQYYKGAVLKQLGRKTESVRAYQKALELYIQQRRMNDPYTEPYGKIYESSIKLALNKKR